MLTRLRSSTQQLGTPVDVASLSAFRVLFGCLMCVAMLRFAGKGWLHSQLVLPSFHFPYQVFSQAHPWPESWLVLHVAVLAFSGLCVALGVRTRLFAGLFFAGFTYLELLDQTLYLNHYYLVSLLAFMLIWLPADGTLSASNWLDPTRSIDTVPAWVLYALRFQIATVYIFAGFAKLNADWLWRAQPLRMWLSARSDLPWVGPWLNLEGVAYVASWGGAAFDLSIVGFLLCRRTRAWAFLAVIVFHLATAVLFSIGMFPWLMIACATLFFSADWPRRLITLPRNNPQVHLRLPRWLGVLLALHCAVQLLLPLRQWVNAEPSAWTFIGFNFSWNVMVAEKSGSVWFEARDRKSDELFRIEPRRYLTASQEFAMAQDPDLIRALAQHIASDLRAREGRDVAVTAQAFAALNGRPVQRLLDPTVDLTRPLPDTWILLFRP